MMPGQGPGSGELTVLCKVHNRRVMLHEVPGYPARLAHISRAGTPADFCESVLYLARYECTADRGQILAELTARAAQESTQ
jgi:hypothetical protein